MPIVPPWLTCRVDPPVTGVSEPDEAGVADQGPAEQGPRFGPLRHRSAAGDRARASRSGKVDLPETLALPAEERACSARRSPQSDSPPSASASRRPSACSRSDCISSSAYGTEQMLIQLVPCVGVGGVHPGRAGHLRRHRRAALRHPVVPRGREGLHEGRRRLRGRPRELRPQGRPDRGDVALLIDYTLTVAVRWRRASARSRRSFPRSGRAGDGRDRQSVFVRAHRLRQPAGHPRGGPHLRPPDVLLRRQHGAPDRRRVRSRRVLGTLHAHSDHRPSTATVAVGTPGAGCSTGPRSSRAARVRQRAARRSPASRRSPTASASSVARRRATPASPSSSMSLDPRLPRARRRPRSPRSPTRCPTRRDADRGGPGGQVRLRARRVRHASSTCSSRPRPCSSSSPAANTSFTGFPFLASFAAEDPYLPRQLTRRGHRLVFSNGDHRPHGGRR